VDGGAITDNHEVPPATDCHRLPPTTVHVHYCGCTPWLLSTPPTEGSTPRLPSVTLHARAQSPQANAAVVGVRDALARLETEVHEQAEQRAEHEEKRRNELASAVDNLEEMVRNLPGRTYELTVVTNKPRTPHPPHHPPQTQSPLAPPWGRWWTVTGKRRGG